MSTTTFTSSTSRSLLQAGLLVGPLFIGVSQLLALVSPGFDFTKHEVSLLLVGGVGPIQSLNFIVTGLLGLTFAVGLRRSINGSRGGTWGPILMGIYGVCLIIAGIAHPDPHHGFPANAPAGLPAAPTAGAGIHSLAFSLLAIAIVANGLVFARRYWASRRPWAIYSMANSVVILALVSIGSALLINGQGGLPLLGVAVAISSWVSVLAGRTLNDASDPLVPDR